MNLVQVVKKNRKMAFPSQWISDEAWAAATYGYGIPKRVLRLIDLPIDDQPTITDVLCCVMRHQARVRFLEIGVSVGKSMTCIARHLADHPDAALHGIDIERMNPTLVRALEEAPRVQDVTYHMMDETTAPWPEEVTAQKYTCVFSDALHEASALHHEYDMLKDSLDLSAEHFCYAFDDLDTEPMHAAVLAIFEKVRAAAPDMNCYFVKVNGWLGQHEHPHACALLCREATFALLNGKTEPR